MATRYGLGLIRQKDDPRDFVYALSGAAAPTTVDLRDSPFMPAVESQGQFNACTSFTALGAAQFAYRCAGYHNPYPPAHMYDYHFSRLAEGDPNQDGGASIRDAFKALNQYGICAEHFFPYIQENLFAAPGPDAIQNAGRHLASLYLAVDPSVAAIRSVLAEGWPVAVGIEVYAGFMSIQTAQTGVVSLPQPGEALEGGHAILLCGYSDVSQQWLFRNSWSTGWGMAGYGALPYAYPVFDSWVLKSQH